MSSNIGQKLLHVLITMGLILSVSDLSASDSAPRPPSAFVRTAQLPSELASAVVPDQTGCCGSFIYLSRLDKPSIPPMPFFRPAPPEIVSLAVAATVVVTAGDRVATVTSDSSYYSEYPGRGYLRDALRSVIPASPRPSSPDQWYR